MSRTAWTLHCRHLQGLFKLWEGVGLWFLPGDHLLGAKKHPWLARLTQTARYAAAGITSGCRDGSAAACSLGRSCGGEGRLPLRPLPCPHRTVFLLGSAGYLPCPLQRWMSTAAALAQPLEDLPPYASNVRRRGC
jgi:hypothetical protein